MISTGSIRWPLSGPGVSRDDLSIGFLQLHQLLSAGVGMERAIHDLCALDRRSSMRLVWLDIAERLGSGQSLPAAMQCWPTAFDDTTIALISAAHANGDLSDICLEIHEHLQWQLNAAERLRTVLVYPVFSLSLLSAVVVFLMLMVVPSLREFILSEGGAVAWHTRLILQLSLWSDQYLLVSGLFLLLAGCSIALCVRCLPVARLLYDSLILKTPLIGTLVLNLSLSRYTRCCSRLYVQGVGLEKSLLMSEATISNQVLKADLETVRLSMIQGVSLSDALSAVPSVPDIVKRMVSIGESSGFLGKTLMHLSGQQFMSAEVCLKRVEQMMGPGIMLVAGSSLLWVVVSILGPVYDTAITVVLTS